jgi:Domain of unknown function (DUF1840)
MLVTFSSKAHADITMFGDIAVDLLKAAGLSGTVPTAILAADIPAALTQLKAALAEHARPLHEGPAADDDPDEEPPVPLGNRALPLIGLLQAAAAAGADVMVFAK